MRQCSQQWHVYDSKRLAEYRRIYESKRGCDVPIAFSKYAAAIVPRLPDAERNRSSNLRRHPGFCCTWADLRVFSHATGWKRECAGWNPRARCFATSEPACYSRGHDQPKRYLRRRSNTDAVAAHIVFGVVQLSNVVGRSSIMRYDRDAKRRFVRHAMTTSETNSFSCV